LYCALSACSDPAQTSQAQRASAPKYSLDHPTAGLALPLARDASFRRGVSLDLFLAEVNETQRAAYGSWLDHAARLGATDLELVVQWSQLDAAALEIAPSATMTVDDEFLGWLMDQANQRQLRVLVTPVIELEQPSSPVAEVQRPEGGPRRALVPAEAAPWFWNYHRFLLHYARIAEAHRAACFAVGADLPDALVQEAAWPNLIKDVRKAYKGKLSYAARWESFEAVPFWSELDEVALAGVGDLWLSGAGGARDKNLAAFAQRLRAWTKDHKRPLLSSVRTGTSFLRSRAQAGASTPAGAAGADPRGSIPQLNAARGLYQWLQAETNLTGVYLSLGRPPQPAQPAPPELASASAEVLRHWYTRSRAPNSN
jgi:hypothetical protein